MKTASDKYVKDMKTNTYLSSAICDCHLTNKCVMNFFLLKMAINMNHIKPIDISIWCY